MQYIKLGSVIQNAKSERCGNREYPVLSITKSDGIVLQSDKFKKRIASQDTDQYKIVHRGQLVQGIHIDEANFGIQDIADLGIVSPAYKIWNIDESLIIPKYLEEVLRSPRSIQYYSSKFNGSVKRRERLSDKDFLAMEIPCPLINEQEHVLSVIRKVRDIIVARKQELSKLDDLIKARFVEMFGDPELNPKGWEKEPLKEHADVLVGYPFPSEGYSEKGTNIVGGYNLMQGYVLWEDSKHWPEDTGYEQYLLQTNDIVMAMDRPWVNGGFKIARIEESHLPALLIQRTACIRSRDLEQEFLHILLDSPRFAEHCNVTGSLVPHISNKDINSFQVILPPMNLQKQFTTFVNQVDKSKAVVQRALDTALLLFDSLMQTYFG